jgi:hypothetical protein
LLHSPGGSRAADLADIMQPHTHYWPFGTADDLAHGLAKAGSAEFARRGARAAAHLRDNHSFRRRLTALGTALGLVAPGEKTHSEPA